MSRTFTYVHEFANEHNLYLIIDVTNSSCRNNYFILRCIHSTCFLGQQIERVAREQTICNPYNSTCPTMYSNLNEFKTLKIEQLIKSSELLAKHVIPCAEYIKIVNQSSFDFILILDIARYNIKNLSLINVSGRIDNIIEKISCCKSLSKLDMSFNKIEEFSKLYDILLNTKLQILNLSFNNIEYLKYVNEDTWRILSQSILEVLDLSNNKLSRIVIQWVLTPSLRVLNCSYNQIRNVYFHEVFLNVSGSQLSTLNLANNQHLTFEINIFDNLPGLTEIDLSETIISSDHLPENVANLCKIYLNRNSLHEYVRFTCKYNPEFEIYLSGNNIQNANAVRMFYSTKVLDISYNLLEDLIGSDCNDISETRILNVSSNMIDFIDESFPVLMKSLEELDLSNNPLRNLERYEIGVNTQLRKLILANSGLLQIDIKISLPLNVHLIQIYITSLCQITTRNCSFSGEELKRYALERPYQKTNDFVDRSQINSKLHFITDSWACEEDYKVVLNLECVENI
ncbi:hypothetical protein GJ496_002006 [Pomphorhynchus laevis]|nr:hypothetical protein GJ496_002006 [Pomphorhynchus laevis]